MSWWIASSGRKPFDPFNVGSRGPPPPLKERSENGPEEKAKDMERRVNALMEEATVAAAAGTLVWERRSQWLCVDLV